MAFPTNSSGQSGQATASLRPQILLVLLAAAAFGLAGLWAPKGPLQLGLFATGTTLFFVSVWVAIAMVRNASPMTDKSAATWQLIENDPAPSMLTGPNGKVIFAKAAAEKTLSLKGTKTLAGALQALLANPGAILFRLETRADSSGAAVEDVVTRQGHLRISVHKVAEGQLLWRVERSAESPQRSADPMPLPMFTLGRNDAICL